MANDSEATKPEEEMLQLLRRHPEIAQRFQAIAKLADGSSGQVLSADQIELLLLQETRALGKVAMEGWAQELEQRLAGQFKEQNPDTRYGKKND
jgi:hypothetical protein